jgi:hypothetical protein
MKRMKMGRGQIRTGKVGEMKSRRRRRKRKLRR